MDMQLQAIVKFLTNPLLPFFALLTIALFNRRHGRWWLLCGVLYMYAVSVPYSSKLTGHWWALDDTVNRQ
ncbi:MAG: hypothetical protein GY868_13275, partial [Deltaproteobacteria bacterium]|nr:hypothetical protein [Deltaproteobacteria bacterium]